MCYATREHHCSGEPNVLVVWETLVPLNLMVALTDLAILVATDS